MQIHKFASISLTMRDRAILSKFSIHRVSQQSTLANFVPSFRAKLMLSFGWTLRMPMRSISSFHDCVSVFVCLLAGLRK